MSHLELLYPLALLFMALVVISGFHLGRRIKSRLWRIGAFLFYFPAAAGFIFLNQHIPVHALPFLLSLPLFVFALAMGSSMRASDERLKSFRQICLAAQYKQLEADVKHPNPLLAADTLAEIASLHLQVQETDKALQAYAKAEAIYLQEKGAHPSLTSFYEKGAQAFQAARRFYDANRFAAHARACRLKMNV